VERAEAEAILDGDREIAVALLMRVGELVEANRRLEARVADLERRLNQSSRNSSLPRSQDPPSASPRPRKRGSGRARGGQPGHEGKSRPLLPLERVDEVVEHWPERCQACAYRFGGEERLEAAAVQRHQVAELPSIAVTVVEHRLHRLRCPVCAAETRAELPAGVPEGAFGPRLQAAVATLAVRNRVSRRDTAELVRELFGAELATGSVDAIVSGAGEALALPAAVFRVAPDRHEREAKALLGEDFEGIACSDRWSAYDYLAPERRQVCWSHLVRDFTAHSEGLAAQKEFGEAGLAIAADVFAAWDEFRERGDRARLNERTSPAKDELRALLEHAARKSAETNYHRLFANNLLKRWPALSTFVHLDGVEPTNNHAERGLRGAVIYRKLSLGSQSEQGERTIERLLSASVTCRLQRRSLFAYLSDLLDARIRADPILALA
jgi:transposase